MFRQQFMDELFQLNMVAIRSEVARNEREELQNIPICNTARMEHRLKECRKRYADPRKRPLSNGLRDHYEYIQTNLEQKLEKARYNQLHKHVMELRQVSPIETKRPSLLQELKQKLASETNMVQVLSKKVKLLRTELNYTDEQHWGLRFHIKQLEQSGENPLLAAKLRTYFDLLFALVTKGGDVANIQDDVDWAEYVQKDKAIKRIIRTILRNEFEIDKCQQLGKQYDEIVVKQERNQLKLDGLLASCCPNM
tara:strand:- start:3932 stop:4687 length:756 start_codon:yes stop_codon:yes gene_type:complete